VYIYLAQISLREHAVHKFYALMESSGLHVLFSERTITLVFWGLDR